MDQPSAAAHHTEDQSEAIAFLGEGAEHIETHAAHVFLKGELALKLKKAVKLPYLDFSTRSLRKSAVEQELKINRAFAPDIYLDVRPVIETEHWMPFYPLAGAAMAPLLMQGERGFRPRLTIVMLALELLWIVRAGRPWRLPCSSTARRPSSASWNTMQASLPPASR